MGSALGLERLACSIISSQVAAGRHQVGAVPEELDVCVLRRGVELVLVPGGLQRAVERALFDLGPVLAGPLPDPVGAGELLRPGDVQAEQVHAAVLGGEPAHHLHPLVVGPARQHPVLDPVASLGLGVAAVDDLLEVLLRRVVQVDRRYAALVGGAAGRHRRDQRQRGRRRPGPGTRPAPAGSFGVAHAPPLLVGPRRAGPSRRPKRRRTAGRAAVVRRFALPLPESKINETCRTQTGRARSLRLPHSAEIPAHLGVVGQYLQMRAVFVEGPDDSGDTPGLRRRLNGDRSGVSRSPTKGS